MVHGLKNVRATDTSSSDGLKKRTLTGHHLVMRHDIEDRASILSK